LKNSLPPLVVGRTGVVVFHGDNFMYYVILLLKIIMHVSINFITPLSV